MLTRCGSADPAGETKIQGVYRAEMLFTPWRPRTRPEEGAGFKVRLKKKLLLWLPIIFWGERKQEGRVLPRPKM